PRAHGRHLDDFAPDQLDVVVALEDTHLAHAVVLLAVEQSSRRRQFDRHRLPPYRVIEQYIARIETLRIVPRRIQSESLAARLPKRALEAREPAHHGLPLD